MRSFFCSMYTGEMIIILMTTRNRIYPHRHQFFFPTLRYAGGPRTTTRTTERREENYSKTSSSFVEQINGYHPEEQIVPVVHQHQVGLFCYSIKNLKNKNLVFKVREAGGDQRAGVHHDRRGDHSGGEQGVQAEPWPRLGLWSAAPG